MAWYEHIFGILSLLVIVSLPFLWVRFISYLYELECMHVPYGDGMVWFHDWHYRFIRAYEVTKRILCWLQGRDWCINEFGVLRGSYIIGMDTGESRTYICLIDGRTGRLLSRREYRDLDGLEDLSIEWEVTIE